MILGLIINNISNSLNGSSRHIVYIVLMRLRRCEGSLPAFILLFIQGFLLCALLAVYEYAPEADAGKRQNSIAPYLNGATNCLPVMYTLYQDVHVMIWIGFGFLMTFLKRYSQSAVGLTFLLGAIFFQVALLCNGAMHIKLGNKAYLSVESLLNADVAVATPLISMGALLGKVTYIQLLFIGTVELIMFTVNKYVGEHLFMVVDAGDSMFVHVFGAYFGLAVSFVFGMKEKPNVHHLEGASYQSDIFAMIGTVFLWLFWPSFNSASLTGDDQQRAVINTVLSISASCIIAFAVSALISKNNKFNMIHVQNSTLAGGVAIGTAAGMINRQKQLYNMVFTLPRCYGLSKVHKLGCPLRVIVSTVGIPTYSVAHFLHKILSNSVSKPASYIRDSWIFVEKINNKKIEQNEVLASLVILLFTNIPKDLVMIAIKKRWHLISRAVNLI